MKVMLLKNVPHLGIIGDVVKVKDGYARNYLVPYGLATEPTDANLRKIEQAKQAYLQQVAKEKAELQAKARLIEGKEVTISARANAEGHLYGSIGPAQIVAALHEQGIVIEEKNVLLKNPFHTLDKYGVKLGFGHDIFAEINVWVVPVREEVEGEQPAEGQ